LEGKSRPTRARIFADLVAVNGDRSPTSRFSKTFTFVMKGGAVVKEASAAK